MLSWVNVLRIYYFQTFYMCKKWKKLFEHLVKISRINLKKITLLIGVYKPVLHIRILIAATHASLLLLFLPLATDLLSFSVKHVTFWVIKCQKMHLLVSFFDISTIQNSKISNLDL